VNRPASRGAAAETGGSHHGGAPVEFDGVTKSYGNLTALHPTSLHIEAGEFFAIIGPSGSGKSTLLGITAGFVPPSGGEVRINGRDILAVPPYRRNIGMVFQNYALFPHMNVAQNVSFPLRMRGMPRAEVDTAVRRVLAMVRLEGFEDRRPAQLSGGQQQRVALARAAVYDPLLLLMDEPLGALDKNLREEMQEEIRKLQHDLGATVLYVTHDQQEAAFMADRIAIMRAGRVEQIGSPRELYEQPANLFVAGFLGEASIFEATEVSRVGAGEIVVRTADGLSIRAHAERSSGSAICVRPERVRLGDAARAEANVFHGVVEDAVYTAGSIRYRVRLDGTVSVVTIRTASQPGMPLHRPGQPVEVGWSPRDALLVPET
jgi:putative spermidine/putrescine transport system ATP-binding protein